MKILGFNGAAAKKGAVAALLSESLRAAAEEIAELGETPNTALIHLVDIVKESHDGSFTNIPSSLQSTFDSMRTADGFIFATPVHWFNEIAGLPEEAVRSFERAIRVSPVDPLLYLTLDGMGRAFIELRRFDEAIVVGKKAQRQNPSYVGAYCCLASAFAHLGRDAEAREAAARMLQVFPAFTISARMGRRRQSHVKLLIEGLRKAGLPE
jgi:predicted Zn-dependent protease